MVPENIVPRTVKIFQGKCHAVVLSTRMDTDTHFCVTILTEDDDNWFISKHGQFSSYWAPELAELLTEAVDWMKKNGIPDIATEPGTIIGKQYGWRLKQ